MRQLFFRALFDYETKPYDEIWHAVDDSIAVHYPQKNSVWSCGTRNVKRDLIAKKLKENEGGIVLTDDFEITIVGDGSRIFDEILITMHEHNFDFIDTMIRKFCQWPEFIFSYATDWEFNNWQNAATPYSYIMANKPHEHIPRLAGQELGKDLWNERLDLSNNPGRTVFHKGYVESIGGVMYVTKKLTDLTGGDLSKLRQLAFLEIDDWGDCLRIEMDANLFAAAENQPELCAKMDAVRAVLFPPKISQ
jgi:hypothetical protein